MYNLITQNSLFFAFSLLLFQYTHVHTCMKGYLYMYIIDDTGSQLHEVGRDCHHVLIVIIYLLSDTILAIYAIICIYCTSMLV